jgi:hypothetical protein
MFLRGPGKRRRKPPAGDAGDKLCLRKTDFINDVPHGVQSGAGQPLSARAAPRTSKWHAPEHGVGTMRGTGAETGGSGCGNERAPPAAAARTISC